jgi:hypothetical protein
MNKVLLLAALLLASPVMADDVAVSSAHPRITWVVISDEVYFCTIVEEPASVKNPICYEAEMKD